MINFLQVFSMFCTLMYCITAAKADQSVFSLVLGTALMAYLTVKMLK